LLLPLSLCLFCAQNYRLSSIIKKCETLFYAQNYLKYCIKFLWGHVYKVYIKKFIYVLDLGLIHQENLIMICEYSK
jgi:hypothetical protein